MSSEASSQSRMQSSFELVVCISSTALFDCSESHNIWKNDGLEAYKKYQRERINVPLKPGVGFRLVQSLLELNKIINRSLVDVVLISRNDAECGQHIIQSINSYELPITRMSFTCGMDVTMYLPAWKCDLFLSTEEEQVRKVIANNTSNLFDGIAAGLVYTTTPELPPVQPNLMPATNHVNTLNTPSDSLHPSVWPEDQVRIVFNGNVVLYSNSELNTSQQLDSENQHTLLSKGPMHVFALKLQKLRQALGEKNKWRIRTFLIFSRNDENTQRVFTTLKEWGLEIDETHILGGVDMTPFLRVIDPAIFFDKSIEHIEQAKQHIPVAHVPHYTLSILSDIDTVVLSRRSSLEQSEQHDVDNNKSY